MQLETKIYQKENNLSVLKILKDSLKDIYKSRFLAKQFTVRDIKAQYRQSYFGILWAFVTPLSTAIVWIFLSSSGTVVLSDTGVPYPVYVFSGTLIWSIIKEAINTPTSSTNGARGILSKINFPKEALIISGIYKLLFNSAIKIILLIILMVIYQVQFQWVLFLFPFGLLAAILFGIALGLLITPISMLYKDIGSAINLGLSFVMYITPVVYVIPNKGIMRLLMQFNPLTPIIEVTRYLLVGGSYSNLTMYFIIIGCSIPLLLLALVWYRISIPIIVERMSA